MLLRQTETKKRGSLICCTSSKKNLNKAQTRTVCKMCLRHTGLNKNITLTHDKHILNRVKNSNSHLENLPLNNSSFYTRAILVSSKFCFCLACARRWKWGGASIKELNTCLGLEWTLTLHVSASRSINRSFLFQNW